MAKDRASRFRKHIVQTGLCQARSLGRTLGYSLERTDYSSKVTGPSSDNASARPATMLASSRSRLEIHAVPPHAGAVHENRLW